jgi:hypothetical protein
MRVMSAMPRLLAALAAAIDEILEDVNEELAAR